MRNSGSTTLTLVSPAKPGAARSSAAGSEPSGISVEIGLILSTREVPYAGFIGTYTPAAPYRAFRLVKE